VKNGSQSRGRASAYAGRWVARVQGRIVAQGGSPSQARLAAQANRHKERLEIEFMAPDTPLIFPPIVGRVASILAGSQAFLAGGAVRDALLGRESHDFDFAVTGNAIGLARRVADGLGADFYVLDQAFDAARVIVHAPVGSRDILDFAGFRGPDIETDLAGRDFTINAIAFDPASGSLLDPLNGGADLRAKTIRVCSATAIQDDPVRILRGVRQAAAFGFKIDADTRAAMKSAVTLLPTVSPERQRDELFRILDGPRPNITLKALEVLGALWLLLPELSGMKGITQSAPHVYDVWEHTLSVLGHLEDVLAALSIRPPSSGEGDLFTSLVSLQLGRYRPELLEHFLQGSISDRSFRSLLFFAALYHDVCKPVTRFIDEQQRVRFFGHEVEATAVVVERGRKFNLSNDEIVRLETIVGNHMRFNSHVARMASDRQTPTRKAIYRFFRDTGVAGVDLVFLGLADLWGTRGHTLGQDTWAEAVEVASLFLKNYWETPAESVDPPRLLDGNDVRREYALKPGPLVGQLLDAMREAQAIGAVSTREAALDFGRRWLGSRGQ
jgi:tRNA nucleotidyltransferase/poly(A) polymerase